jgi:glycosyltransferase involved in cell wall biosynthesis
MRTKKTIVHISEAEISLSGGMGRIEYHWKRAFEDAGYEFVHIGPGEVGKMWHKSLFGYRTYRLLKGMQVNPCALIVHEPSALFFSRWDIPVFIESHGIERRQWELELEHDKDHSISAKTRLLYPLWRLLSCDAGIKKARKLLLSNYEDKAYVLEQYRRKEEDVFVFRNGINPVRSSVSPQRFTVLFNASWIKRKGNQVLVQAAALLFKKGEIINYLIIGAGKSAGDVLHDWPGYLRPFVTVVPAFDGTEENNYLDRASIVVLPSNFEGQPLSLLQAMAAGKCCITTNCCGQKDLIEDQISGFLFEPYDSQRLSELIETCINDQPLTARIGAAARLSVQDRTWEDVSYELVKYVTDHIRH